jgi:hypothetical protein
MSIKERILNEPVVVTTFVSAFLALLLAFNVDLTDEQIASIMAFVAAVLAFVVRSKVTPVRKSE